MANGTPAPHREEIDWFDPLIVFAFVSAFVGDLLSILIIPHYILGSFVIAAIWPKSHGLAAKLVLIVAFAIPFPFFLLAGACAAVALSKSKFLSTVVETVVEQAAIQGIAAVTGGAGEALEGVALAGGAAEGAAVVAETAEVAGAAAEIGEATGAVAQGAEAAGEGAEAATEAGKEVEGEAEKSITDKFTEKAKEKIKEKIRERIKNGLAGPDEDENREPTDEEVADEAAKMAEGEKLEREGFGMPGTPEEELNKELFPVTPPISSKKVIEFPGRQAAQQPPRPAQDNKRSAESMTSADRLREANQKGAALQKQWESARGAEGGDDAVDIGKAA